MKYKFLLATLASMALTGLFVLAGCESKDKKETAEAKAAPKYLVLYYSQNGTTKMVAEEIQKALGADIEAFEVEEPYTGSFEETIARVGKEKQDGIIPKVKPIQADIEKYDVIFLGYPIWFGTFAPPMAGLVDVQKFKGKRIVPFCSFGSGGLEVSVKDLKAALPEAVIAEGYGVRTARTAAIPAEVNRFLIENKFVEGSVEQLPEFSAPTPVTEAETKIFDAACGDYQFPLGTPVTFGKRSIAQGTEYKFDVKSLAPDGSEASAIIYVVVGNSENEKPVFTRVVR